MREPDLKKLRALARSVLKVYGLEGWRVEVTYPQRLHTGMDRHLTCRCYGDGYTWGWYSTEGDFIETAHDELAMRVLVGMRNTRGEPTEGQRAALERLKQALRDNRHEFVRQLMVRA